MDRSIDPVVRRRRRAKRIATGGALLAGLVLGTLLVSGWMRPSVARRSLRTAKVDRGPVEATLQASGTIVPDGEHVLSSPVDTRVVRLLLSPGATVHVGDAVVELDTSAARLEVDRLEERIALSRNAQASERLLLEEQLGDLAARRDIQTLEVQSLEMTAERSRKLLELGITSQDDQRLATVNLERARITLQQMERSIESARQASAMRIEKLQLEARILEKDRAEAAHRLALAAARSDRDGVLTWVLPTEGAAVRQGDVLARIADLSAFRVEARITDVVAERLSAGLAARVQVGDLALEARVAKVLPSVEAGTLGLHLDLTQRSHPGLRANQRAEVQLVTDRKSSVLRVQRGAFATTADGGMVFVVRGRKAVRSPIRLGVTGFEQCEIVDGLQEGDEVVLSDMSDYLQAKEVRLR